MGKSPSGQKTQLGRKPGSAREPSKLHPQAVLVVVEDLIVFASPAAAKMLGAAAPSRLIGAAVAEFLPDDELRSLFVRVLQTEQSVASGIHRVKRLDDSVLAVDLVAGPLLWKGRSAVQVFLRIATRWSPIAGEGGEANRKDAQLVALRRQLRDALDAVQAATEATARAAERAPALQATIDVVCRQSAEALRLIDEISSTARNPAPDPASPTRPPPPPPSGVGTRYEDASRAAPGVSGHRLEEGSGHRVLLVEDDADAAEMLQRGLQRFGHDVAVARRGCDALDSLNEHGADLLLCDIGLPDMCGLELARIVRGEEKFVDLPLVALSGRDHPDDLQRSADAGFSLHLVKPVALRSLALIIERLATTR